METIKAKEYRNTLKKVWKIMGPSGRRSGKEIAKVARKIHPKAIAIIPMYRSALVVIGHKSGDWQRVYLKAYHDPQWLGKEINKKILADFCQDFIFNGHRSHTDVFRDGYELWPLENALMKFESAVYMNELRRKNDIKKRGRNV